MANFGSIIEWVLRLEDRTLRGKTANLGDGAGLTRFGITSKNHPNLDPAFWNFMPVDQALEVAKQLYYDGEWAAIRGSRIANDELAATLMSFAVNDGVSAAVKLLQRVLGLNADGVLGPISLANINAAKSPESLAESLRDAQWAYYEAVLAAHPEREVNRNGWRNRAYARYPDLP
jgi:lysozyme family protein